MAKETTCILGRLTNVLLVIGLALATMPNILLGTFVVAVLLVITRSARGASLSGPRMTAPLVVMVGSTPYTVTRSGQPYGVTEFIILIVL